MDGTMSLDQDPVTLLLKPEIAGVPSGPAATLGIVGECE